MLLKISFFCSLECNIDFPFEDWNENSSYICICVWVKYLAERGRVLRKCVNCWKLAFEMILKLYYWSSKVRWSSFRYDNSILFVQWYQYLHRKNGFVFRVLNSVLWLINFLVYLLIRICYLFLPFDLQFWFILDKTDKRTIFVSDNLCQKCLE